MTNLPRTCARTTGSAGYSLIELLLAMGLFAALSTGLIALLARSSEFLTSGASQTETLDAIQTFSNLFGADVSSIASRPDFDTGRPDVRLFCDWAAVDINGDKRDDVNAQRLFFVTVVPDDPASGLSVNAKEFRNQIDDEKKVADGKLRSNGGLMEVFWTALPESESNLAVMQIWRGYSSPPGKLIPVKSFRDPLATAVEKGPVSPADMRARAKPVLSGVLYFAVEFWSRKTKTWDSKVRPRDGGPLVTWDSTRGILPQGEDAESFYLSKSKGYQDTASLNDPTDDTFPRKIRVTCVVEELGRNARVGYMTEALSIDAKTINLADTRFFPATDTAQRFVKIDGEWMEVGVPTGGTMPVVRRGVRGTIATAHSAGAMVHHGRTLVQEYDVAAFRDTYRDDLSSLTGRGYR